MFFQWVEFVFVLAIGKSWWRRQENSLTWTRTHSLFKICSLWSYTISLRLLERSLEWPWKNWASKRWVDWFEQKSKLIFQQFKEPWSSLQFINPNTSNIFCGLHLESNTFLHFRTRADYLLAIINGHGVPVNDIDYHKKMSSQLRVITTRWPWDNCLLPFWEDVF